MSMKFFHAANANRSGLPVKFNLYEQVGTWWGVCAVADEKVQAALASVPAVEEISEEQYLLCVKKMDRLPEEMRPVIPVHGAPQVVGDGVPVIPNPKKIETTVALETVLTPVKVETNQPAAKPKIDPTSRLGKHAVKKSASVLPTDTV